LYAQYFNEDDYYQIGRSQTADEKEALRKRIVAISVLSMVMSTVIAPVLCGFLSALYLTKEQFIEFVWFLVIVKIILLVFSLNKIRSISFVKASKSFLGVIALYLLYLYVIWRIVTMVHDWTVVSIGSLGVVGMLWALLDYVFVELFLYVLIVSASTWALVFLFTSPKYIHR
jgi:hypothetical protein